MVPSFKWSPRFFLCGMASATLLAIGCVGASSATAGGTGSTASRAQVTITFWSWVPGIQDAVTLFEQKHPDIEVNLVNAGVGAAEYQKLRIAMKAGTGVPDVFQLGVKNLSSFVITDDIRDLKPLLPANFLRQFVPWAGAQVSDGTHIWAVPQDSGPMTLLYRKDIFDKYRIAIPKTWIDFRRAAKKLHAADPNIQLTNLGSGPNDGALWLPLTIQAGAQPFRLVSKDTLSIKLTDPAATKVANFWTGLLKQGLVGGEPQFTPSWFQALSEGRYASLVTAAWMPAFLASTIKTGKWRATQLPHWGGPKPISANYGGSVSAVWAKTRQPRAAATFAAFINTDPTVTRMLNQKSNLFPVTKALLSSKAFLNVRNQFFGGQQSNRVFTKSSELIARDIQWPPITDFVDSSFASTLAKAISTRGYLTHGLAAWQRAVVAYAREQGFKVR